ncbi:MAG TPA: glycine--tRNA ligase subunit beta [Firmicutes bacterium]|nr:glycine--tRNA ligase subunit beta [Bacillota bacterium]
MQQDFLLELGFEELPARFISGALQQLTENISGELKKERLPHGEIAAYGTPRRLAVLISDMSARQKDLVQEIKGPPQQIAYDEKGQLTPAGTGFLRSQGAVREDIFIKDLNGARYLFIKKESKGKETLDLLKPLLEKVIKGLSFPKNMRWEAAGLRFARPLRWLVALFGATVIPLRIADVTAGRFSYGHRQLSLGPLEITEPAVYAARLKENFVLADQRKRRELIWRQIKSLAVENNARALEDEALLAEITNLVEYPTAFCGSFAPEYLTLPAEVLITSMKEHQRYFPLHDEAGRLLPKFVGVRNGADNHLENVIAGNEKVLAARLADAKFFYDEDSKTPLEENLKELERVVFQDGLGSMSEKVNRLVRLSGILADKLGYSEEKAHIVRTAKLAKADLVTQMVGEFPELQGVMGEKYATLQKEPRRVALGIKEHYQPRSAQDGLPTTVEGAVVGLADKCDSLVGYFALGLIPTGSQDPFALRRMAQGVVQILHKRDLPLSLNDLIDEAAAGYRGAVLDAEKKAALLDFFQARLKVYLREQGYRYDEIDACLAAPHDRINDLVSSVAVLAEFRQTPAFTDLLTGFERMNSLALQAEGDSLDSAALTPADRDFKAALHNLQEECSAGYAARRYEKVLHSLAQFRGPVDEFFEQVMIMAQDPARRQNRLILLKRAVQVYTSYGDFSRIVVN